MTIKIPAGLSRFFTLKTELQLHAEEQAARKRQAILDRPHGLRSFIGDKQKEVDAIQAKTDAFLADIEAHFGDATKYLTPAYTGRTKYENIEKSRERRIGVKWVDRAYTYADCVHTTISFAYTETSRGVRVDYILKRLSGEKKVINDDYNPDSDEIHKVQHDCDDSFRTVRRYENHGGFVDSGDHPPQWFVEALSTRVPVA